MKKELNTLINLDFDQFGRIYAAKNAIEGIRKKNEKFKILDVGGYKGNTPALFPDDSITVVDQYDVKEKNYIQADALNLPFTDDEFDIVVSFDVFEHIAPTKRNTYLSELTRVSNKMTIIAAPFKSELAEKGEMLVNNYYKYLTKKPHPWLNEHIMNSLPEEKIIKAFLKKHNLNYMVIDNNNMVLWNYLQHATLLTGLASNKQSLKSTNAFYNSHINQLEDSNDVSYRKIYIIGEFNKNSNTVKKNTPNPELLMQLTDILFREIGGIILEKNTTIEELKKVNLELNKNLSLIDQSLSWKITKPFRREKRFAKQKNK